jgi:hypothetical protein
MAFIENVGFYRKLGFVVYGNEYAAMPKIIISAQAVIDAIEKQEIYRLTGPGSLAILAAIRRASSWASGQMKLSIFFSFLFSLAEPRSPRFRHRR